MENETLKNDKAVLKASRQKQFSSTDPVENPNENHNVRKEALGPNARRKR